MARRLDFSATTDLASLGLKRIMGATVSAAAVAFLTASSPALKDPC